MESSAVSIDFDGLPLTSGQIIVGETGSAIGMLLALLAEDYVPYSHSGILVIEEGKPFVYEQRAMLRPRLRGPPTDALKGRVRKTTLRSFLARQTIAAIYSPPPGVDATLIAKFAVQQYSERTPFDAYFDAEDQSALYCSELVALALEAAGVSSVFRTPRHQNSSVETVLNWLKIGADSFYLPGALPDSLRQVALLSRTLSTTEIIVHFEIRRELHRRFTSDQQLGNLFRWALGRPRFREDVAKFIRQTTLAVRDRELDEAAMQQEVRQRATIAFGELTAPRVRLAAASGT